MAKQACRRPRKPENASNPRAACMARCASSFSGEKEKGPQRSRVISEPATRPGRISDAAGEPLEHTHTPGPSVTRQLAAMTTIVYGGKYEPKGGASLDSCWVLVHSRVPPPPHPPNAPPLLSY